MSGDLVKKLRAVGGLCHDGATRWFVNPNGPEAASRIEALEAALREIAAESYEGISENDFCHPEGCGSPGIARTALAGEKKDE